MTLMHRRLRLLLGLLLSLLSLQVLAKKDKPAVESTTFKKIDNLFYFDDSDIVVFYDRVDEKLYRSEDAGKAWAHVKAVDDDLLEVLKHPYIKDIAVAVSVGNTHWITKDQGKTWTAFTTGAPPTMARPAISFHASDPDRLLFMSQECLGLLDCRFPVYYTTDGFKTKPALLVDQAFNCLWAKNTDTFTTGDKKLDQDQILCNVMGEWSGFSTESRLLVTSDFFETKGVEPALEGDRAVKGIINIAGVKSYIVAAAKSDRSTEMALYVTDDTITWHRAEFGFDHKVEEDAYTLLEGTNYSMQVDVMTSKRGHAPMGVLFTSNSNGTFFTQNIEHTNRGELGYVDFEKIQGIQGIVMVNTVLNWEAVEESYDVVKQLVTRISFDDGRNWQPLKAGNEDLHLHSVTEQRNLGRIFSTHAPGIVMGVGNTGKYIQSRSEGDLYVSDNAGLTWILALEGPHLYEFGDQGAVLVAVEDGETDKIKWSLNHGLDWDEMSLDYKFRPIALTTTPDSTSLKFVIEADKGKGTDVEHRILAVDFADLHERTCKKSDFENWYARVDQKGEPTCIMGHTQSYRRRKADAECFVDEEFEDPQPLSENCKCTEMDFECDATFARNEDGKCFLQGKLPATEGQCQEGKETYMGPSGYRLIPGNTCIKQGGVDLEKSVERKCQDVKEPPTTGKVYANLTTFKADSVVEYYYLERCPTCHGDDETIIMRTNRREVYITRDHGKQWALVDLDEEVVAIYPHQYDNDRVYLITPKNKVYYSENRGKSIGHFTTPEKPNTSRVQILSFHPKEKTWLIWVGGKDCTGLLGSDCQTIAQVSTSDGEGWEPLLKDVRKCQFVYREDRPNSDELIYCESYDEGDMDGSLSLVSSNDWFKHSEILKRDVINFAMMSEYIVVALKDEDEQSLKVDTTIDGVEFADARFPSNFHVTHQQAYTVLDSSTHAVFLHVTVNGNQDQEYGSIVKSNSNGTSYVLSINEVNRNTEGYVDFEKMQGLEGVAIVNVVGNPKETDGGAMKKLKTKITHNDGADWAYITRPEKSADDSMVWCDGPTEKCSLHIHGYTERSDPRSTFSSPSAVGLMVGVGNVGEYLGPYQEADTFITRDGGITWRAVAKGVWAWEYGDQGSVIVAVKRGEPVNSVMYTLNEGEDWSKFTFSDDLVTVDAISTLPSDTSLNFLLWCKAGNQLATVNLDFTGLEERSKECVLSEQDPTSDKSDYFLWSPSHPDSENDCLFGHVAQYHRKKLDRDCRNGKQIDHLHSIARNCTCTRRDFECDYNFERQTDGSCKLVPGLQAPDPEAVCAADKNLLEYYDITGYRRIPLTTCEGGQELDYTSRVRPCPDHEDEFEKKHGISGAGLFFAVVIPIAAAAGVGYWVFRNWDGKFGRIQLGDSGAVGSRIGVGGAFDGDAPWIKYPVLALSGIIAVVAAIPMVVDTVYRTLRTRFSRSSSGRYGPVGRPYTSRGSFQRGRGGYSTVDPDEGELLGDESDEEI